jgi:hypothetical protein
LFQSRCAESEKEKTALAKCLAEVLPIHLDLFATEDLADLQLTLMKIRKWILLPKRASQDNNEEEEEEIGDYGDRLH